MVDFDLEDPFAGILSDEEDSSFTDDNDLDDTKAKPSKVTNNLINSAPKNISSLQPSGATGSVKSKACMNRSFFL